MSVAGGVVTAPARGLAIGADVIQIFSKQSTRWAGRALEEEEARAFREEIDRTGIRAVAVHAAYLINLGSANEGVRTRSLYALEDEAARAAMLGIPHLVLHPGSSGEDSEDEGVRRVGAALRTFGRFPEGVTLLLENTAGQGNTLGRTVDRIRRLHEAAGDPPDVGACLDSAHLFAAGYDMASGDGWRRLVEEIDANGLLPLVRLWHLNDSKTPRGGRVDRHEHIGRGMIGLEGFRRIVTHPPFAEIPMILETPKDGEDEFEMDIRNLAVLKKLRGAGRPRGERTPRGKGR